MKIYTQAEFDNFEVINGYKQCPIGNYEQIKVFGKWCSFGNGCSFGEGCSFGKWCSFGKGCQIIGILLRQSSVYSISSIGNEKRTLYMWDTEEGIYFQAGCRIEKENSFIIAVKESYGENSQYEKAMQALKNLHGVN